ncbi:hypothetical protein F5X68DRAFT_276509 [Plectosphaerella plurivora]|uniref:Uncharacterized protein n=1 Tax=Plectosphaerella plurivora TaxID=936078 RepID=A0A9P9A7L4_9PEZI|nr:hypothetical protein F5X68DRAFT_276509 [Plectosphaerella plurivora]
MHVLSLVLAAATAVQVQAGSDGGSNSILVRRALNGTSSPAVMHVTDTEVPAWGAPKWEEEAHAADAGMLSAGQKLSTQTYVSYTPLPCLFGIGRGEPPIGRHVDRCVCQAAEDRDSMIHVEPTGHVAPPAEEAEDAEVSNKKSQQQQQQQHVPKGPDFSWMWSVDGALALGMVIVSTGLVFSAAG